MIAVTIDGRRLETAEGRTILQLAREHGIPIPTLCYHEAMEPFAACRMCVVEVDTPKGRQLVASCAYPCSEGLVVYTQTEAVQRSRRMTVEFLMASSAHVPLIRRLADELGLGEPRFRLPANDCVLCGLCVRACKEIVGVGAISLVNRGIDKRVSPPFGLASNVCIGCGTCVLVCPTGAITLDDITGTPPRAVGGNGLPSRAGGAASVHRFGSEFHAESCRVCGNRVQAPEGAAASPSLPRVGEKEAAR